MADCYTEAAISNAPLENVPPPVVEFLKGLSDGKGVGAVDAYLEAQVDPHQRTAALTDLLKFNILVDTERCEGAELCELYETASGNTVTESGIFDSSGDFVAPSYSDEFAREYLSNVHVLNDELEAAAHVTTFVADEDGLYVYWEIDVPDIVMDLLRWLLSQMPSSQVYLQVNAAQTCSAPRPDGFGGWSALLTRDSVRWFHADTLAHQAALDLVSAVEGVKEVRPSPAPFKVVDNSALAFAFIDANDLTNEFGEFVRSLEAEAALRRETPPAG